MPRYLRLDLNGNLLTDEHGNFARRFFLLLFNNSKQKNGIEMKEYENLWNGFCSK